MRDATRQEDSFQHIPVLYHEVLEGLNIRPGRGRRARRYIDATVGLGGHARGILEGSTPDGRLLALDADPAALTLAREHLAEFAQRVTWVCGRHSELASLARRHGFDPVDGILMDLGVSSLQLDDPSRGFSFQTEGPLDMRMSDEGLTAEQVVNTWDEQELARIIYEYGEERHSRRIAGAICAHRPLHTTTELADVVASAVRRAAGRKRERIHPATRTFQALRLVVNDELASLEAALPQAVELLAPEGRLAVIAFHSLEDRIVKQFLRRESRDCLCPPRLPTCVCGHQATVKELTRKPIRPTDQEVARNPRSRSARMRVAERLH
jgi:16S rRNA (cytosine1402-N4)-methyltransferase